MRNFIFSLKYSVSDEPMIVSVKADSQSEAFHKLENVYSRCPNIDYIGHVSDTLE